MTTTSQDDTVPAALQNVDLDKLAALAEKIDLNELIDLGGEKVAHMLRTEKRKERPYNPPPINGDFYAIFDSLTPDQNARRLKVRQTFEEEICPVINPYWEAGEFPMDLIPVVGKLATEVINPGDYAYPSRDPMLTGIVSMEMGRAEPSVSTFYGMQYGLCMPTIYLYGSDDQKAKWLPPLQRFEKIGSWALTEPDVGSAAARGLETTAERRGSEWIINGAKKWSGNAPFADVNVIWARDTEDGQVKAFLVELDNPGYHVEKLGGKISKRTVQNANITLVDCVVSEADRLPGVRSFQDTGRQLAVARAGVAWEAVGVGLGAYEKSLAYAQQRMQFGKPITGFQLVQDMFVEMLGNVTASLTMMFQLAKLQEAEDGWVSHERASLAKVFCCEKMRETVAIARAALGGNGILLEHDVARLFADAEGVYSYEGTHEMNTLIVGRAITGLGAFV